MLYVCEPVIRECKGKGWQYILRLKEEKTTEFIWITSFKITEKNKEELVYFGRQRWKIENKEPQNMVTNMFTIKKSYLYWLAEIWFCLYVIIVITIININEMIVRATFANNDNINNFCTKSNIILYK